MEKARIWPNKDWNELEMEIGPTIQNFEFQN